MTLLLTRTVISSVLLALASLCVGFTPATSYAQETSSEEVPQETLKDLLPEPPEGFERSISPAAEGKDRPWAQAVYVSNRPESGEERTRAAEKCGDNPVVFEVEISGVTEEEKTRVLSQMKEAPPAFEITTEEYEGHPLHVITGAAHQPGIRYYLHQHRAGHRTTDDFHPLH